MTSPEPYLLRLAGRLAGGIAHMDPDRRDRHRAFLLSQQREDGGFAGRDGGADLYYTGFAVRALAMLDALAPETCGRIASFIRSEARRPLGVVDLVSWLYTALVLEVTGGVTILDHAAPGWNDQLALHLETTRAPDGGYAKSPDGVSSSTYHTFLVALTCELIGKQVPAPERLVQFVLDRQRDDGGFVEIGPMTRGGTNPTAAAIALLTMFGGLNDDVRTDVRGFLEEVRAGEGGFQANTRIPFADGLSTFTGLLTAQDLALEDVVDLQKTEEFLAQWLEFPTGGFRGASWDTQADVEYTFYGLGALALLWS